MMEYVLKSTVPQSATASLCVEEGLNATSLTMQDGLSLCPFIPLALPILRKAFWGENFEKVLTQVPKKLEKRNVSAPSLFVSFLSRCVAASGNTHGNSSATGGRFCAKGRKLPEMEFLLDKNPAGSC